MIENKNFNMISLKIIIFIAVKVALCICKDVMTYCASISVTCYPGHYLDDSLECQKCPFSGYCEDGISWQSCPDKMVTEEEGSFYDGDCKNGKIMTVLFMPHTPGLKTRAPAYKIFHAQLCRA